MSEPIFYDTETVGLQGPIVLLQYAQGDDPVSLHSVWTEPISDTMEIIEWMMNNAGGVIGFNLAFDHFHLCQLYTTLARLRSQVGDDELPEEHINLYAELEPGARDGDCLKPVSVCDLMLVARRGPYQSMMARKPIRIRKVPAILAIPLAAELEERLVLNEIYFSKRKNKNLPKWQVKECRDRKNSNRVDPAFNDIVLDFKASTALKVIANDMLGEDRYGRQRFTYGDIELNKKHYPGELGYAPFALATSTAKARWRISDKFPIRKIRRKYSWPGVIKHHISHWTYGTHARMYAEDDVKDTRGIWKGFDYPQLGDVDSELACMVGAVRWRGFTIDPSKIQNFKEEAIKIAKRAPRSPREVKDYLSPLMTPIEKLSFTTTDKVTLTNMAGDPENAIIGWQVDCPDCNGVGTRDVLPMLEASMTRGMPTLVEKPKVLEVPCTTCEGSGGVDHPVTEKARLVLKSRKAKKDIEIYDKLLIADRFHASFSVIGTLSSRMSGSDNLNPQAIRNDKTFRSAFTLAHSNSVLCGGDFSSFEVSLAEANYNDAKLREQLLSTTECYLCGGQNPECKDCFGTNKTPMKIHALFGTMCFPQMSYAEIVKNKIIYTRSKSGFFSQIYGGNFSTLMSRLGVDEESAMKAEARFTNTYDGVKRARQLIFDKFCSMRQPNGIGTKVIWHEPSDYIENMLDPPFRRYFLLENQIAKVLFELANTPPKGWREFKDFKVWRRDREQTAGGAVQSALYGAAFQIQAANMRAAANHVIQSTGAEITKAVQFDIWKLQPPGINRWRVQPMNIHDEIEVVIDNDPNLVDSVQSVVMQRTESYRPLVPLIGIEWKNYMKSWGEK